MTTLASRTSSTTASLLSVLCVAALGLTLLFVAGHAQSGTLHAAAHDMRHANGFPCH